MFVFLKKLLIFKILSLESILFVVILKTSTNRFVQKWVQPFIKSITGFDA